MVRKLVVLGFGVALLASGAFASEATLRGLYLEARTADVHAGHCFANSEVGLTGREAILAWSISEGSYEGVPLAGLKVVAVVKAQATLGDPHATPHPADSVLIVDEGADADQREALIQFAREKGGALLNRVQGIHDAAVEAAFDERPGFASLKAGELVELETRAITHKDHLCGSEFVYYDPLTEVDGAVPAYTEKHAFRGDDFDATWSCPLKRSAFVASFAH